MPPVYPLAHLFTSAAIASADALWSNIEIGSIVVVDNDPWGEHDYAMLTVNQRRIIFKVHYFRPRSAVAFA